MELGLTNDIPIEVERVVISCLSKNAAHRPQSAAEVWRLLNGEKLKLLETQHGLETRRTMTVSAPVRAPSLKALRRWYWIAAGVLACGIGLWAVTHAAKRTPVAAKETVPSVAPTLVGAPVIQGTTPPFVAKSHRPAASVQSNPPPVSAKAINVASPVGAVKVAPVLVAKVEPTPVVKAPDKVESPTPETAVETNAVATLKLSQATALQLLEKGNSFVSTRSKNRIVQMVSGRAAVDAPPQTWRILYFDDKTTYNAVEVQFEGGEMERVFEPNRIFNLFTSGSSKTLDLAKVKVDSDQAIRVALAECAEEPVRVNFVELKLERGYGGLPVWNVKLFGINSGKAVDDAALGSVIVLAEDGKVLKKDITTKSEKPAVKK